MKTKILIPMVILAAVLAGGAFWAWQSQKSGQDPSLLTLHGNVDIHQVSLAFNANERIAELRVKEGDTVHAGDVLALLDSRTSQLRLTQAQAQVAIQAQALQRLKAGSRSEEVAKARAGLAASEAEVDLANNQVLRLQSVSEASGGKGVSRQDLDNAVARLQVARAQALSTRKATELVELGPRKEDIDLAEKQLNLAKAEEALVQRAVEETQLRAPIDAVVRARLLERGDMASPQRPVFTLAITQPKWVRTYVSESRLRDIHTGMEALISTDSQPERSLVGRVTYIGSVAEFTPKTVQTEELRTSLVYEVRVTVEDPKDQLRLGMPATVHLKLTVGGAAQ